MTEAATGPRIGLVHAVSVAMAPIDGAFNAAWPATERIHLLDTSLGPDRARDGELTAMMRERIGALGQYAIQAGATAVLYTCSAFGPAIEDFAGRTSVPVLKPNEAMFAQALTFGATVGMLATFEPSIASMEAEFRAMAGRRGQDARIHTILVDDALDALKHGDGDSHDRLVANRARDLGRCDVVMLAHFSTARARDAVASVLAVPVLTSPSAAVEALRKRLA